MGTKTQKLSNVVDQIVEWQSVFTGDGSTGLTAVAGRGYFIDTTSGTVTVTLPTDANSKLGDTIIIRDYAGTFATNNVTITSTAKISEADADGTLSTNDLVMTLTYVNSTKGWVTMENEAKAIGAQDTTFISATGGTILTVGDFKTHVFTGDGCFVVSQGPVGEAPGAEYLVVAGGGGGGGLGTAGGVDVQAAGAGGGGGFRSFTALACASPLNACSALTVSATTYPITVGGGGAVDPGNTCGGSPGSDSVFSTITSAGGGGGGSKNGSGGKPGGSGGSGAGHNPPAPPNNCAPGTGNTPPTSPPQGNNGGSGASHGPCNVGSGGGGGAGAAGTSSTADDGFPGGDGSYVPDSFFGPTAPSYGQSPAPLAPNGRYFAGGGGGASSNTPGNPGTGGAGGGGTGAAHNPPVSNTAGGTNTGGGAGADGGPLAGQGKKTGGKGIVVIRYKFQ